MNNDDIKSRVEELEREVKLLKLKAEGVDKSDPRWWLATAGMFKDDPWFEDAVRLGREYRESLRPGAKKKLAKRSKKKAPRKVAS
jgi:hypothetical protein